MTFNRIQGLLAGGVLALTSFSFAPPSQAVEGEPPPEQQYYVSNVTAGQNPNENLVVSLILTLSGRDGSNPTPGTEIRADIYSCGRFLQSGVSTTTEDRHGVLVWLSPDGKADLSPNSVNRLVGPSVQYVLTIAQPGYPTAYVREGSYNGWSVNRPSCDQISTSGGGGGCTVSKWSVKKFLPPNGTKAFVGGRTAVTPTRANCRITYAWKVAGRVVDRDRYLGVKRAYRGKYLAMKVSVGKAGGTTKIRTLRYGKVVVRNAG